MLGIGIKTTHIISRSYCRRDRQNAFAEGAKSQAKNCNNDNILKRNIYKKYSAKENDESESFLILIEAFR